MRKFLNILSGMLIGTSVASSVVSCSTNNNSYKITDKQDIDNSLMDTSKEISKLNNVLNSIIQKTNDVKNALSNAEVNVQTANDVINSLQDKLDSIDKTLSSNKAEIDSLNQQISDANKLMSQYQQEVDKQKKLYNDLTSQDDTVQKQITSAKSKKSSLQQKIANINKNLGETYVDDTPIYDSLTNSFLITNVWNLSLNSPKDISISYNTVDYYGNNTGTNTTSVRSFKFETENIIDNNTIKNITNLRLYLSDAIDTISQGISYNISFSNYPDLKVSFLNNNGNVYRDISADFRAVQVTEKDSNGNITTSTRNGVSIANEKFYEVPRGNWNSNYIRLDFSKAIKNNPDFKIDFQTINYTCWTWTTNNNASGWPIHDVGTPTKSGSMFTTKIKPFSFGASGPNGAFINALHFMNPRVPNISSSGVTDNDDKLYVFYINGYKITSNFRGGTYGVGTDRTPLGWKWGTFNLGANDNVEYPASWNYDPRMSNGSTNKS